MVERPTPAAHTVPGFFNRMLAEDLSEVDPARSFRARDLGRGRYNEQQALYFAYLLTVHPHFSEIQTTTELMEALPYESDNVYANRERAKTYVFGQLQSELVRLMTPPMIDQVRDRTPDKEQPFLEGAVHWLSAVACSVIDTKATYTAPYPPNIRTLNQRRQPDPDVLPYLGAAHLLVLDHSIGTQGRRVISDAVDGSSRFFMTAQEYNAEINGQHTELVAARLAGLEGVFQSRIHSLQGTAPQAPQEGIQMIQDMTVARQRLWKIITDVS